MFQKIFFSHFGMAADQAVIYKKSLIFNDFLRSRMSAD